MMLQGTVSEGTIVGYNKGGVLVDIGELKGEQQQQQQMRQTLQQQQQLVPNHRWLRWVLVTPAAAASTMTQHMQELQVLQAFVSHI
jgi:ribosomal protein S1